MTDLLNRPSATSPSERSRGRFSGLLPAELFRRRSGPPTAGEPEGRPLTVTAAIAAVGAAGTTMVTFMGLAVIGWFLADAGAHGQTTDALRVGADVWLVGHGAQLTASGVPLGIVPLTVTAVLAVVLFRFGRWAGVTAQPVDDDRTVAAGGHDPDRHLRRDRGDHLRARHPGVRQPQPRPGDPRLHAGRRCRRHPRHGRRHRPAPRVARAGARLDPGDRVRRRCFLPAPGRGLGGARCCRPGHRPERGVGGDVRAAARAGRLRDVRPRHGRRRPERRPVRQRLPPRARLRRRHRNRGVAVRGGPRTGSRVPAARGPARQRPHARVGDGSAGGAGGGRRGRRRARPAGLPGAGVRLGRAARLRLSASAAH